jgi:ribosome-associated translation inhibitor RaiA
MKSASIPSIRVTPDIRADIESLLAEGETLSQFVEASVMDAVRKRRAQAEFVARGLSALADARDTGRYVTPQSLLKKLEQKLERARRKAKASA